MTLLKNSDKSLINPATLWVLTHWGRVTHICVSKLTILGSDNGLSPDRRQAIIWTNVGILLIGPLGANFSEILIEILTFSSDKMRSKVLSAKRRPFCLCLNVLSWLLLVPSVSCCVDLVPLWGMVLLSMQLALFYLSTRFRCMPPITATDVTAARVAKGH